MSGAVIDRPKRKREDPPIVDPTTRYALDVRSGAIVACRAVRMACERHLKDLERQRTPEFPYYFDVAGAQHLLDFFPSFLTLENGEPFHLPPWLVFCYGCIFGWKRVSDGRRRFKYAHIEVPRKNSMKKRAMP